MLARTPCESCAAIYFLLLYFGMQVPNSGRKILPVVHWQLLPMNCNIPGGPLWQEPQGEGISSFSIYEAWIYAGVQAGQHWGMQGISTDSVHGFEELFSLGSSGKHLHVADGADPQSPVATRCIRSSFPPQNCSWGSAQPRFTDHTPLASIPECISCSSGDQVCLCVFSSLQPSPLGTPLHVCG